MQIKPQARNANRHTSRGMQALEQSLATDGWIGAITVAADGETFDGSARVEKTAENGMLDDGPPEEEMLIIKATPNRPIRIESDGTSPLIHIRTDIPSAADPRAVRLGLAANRVASLNLEWEPDVLAEILAEQGAAISPVLFTPMEAANAAMLGDATPIDPAELWKGMPDFEYNPKAFKSIQVHFATEDDYEAFARLINQTLTAQTRSIWHPYKPNDELKDLSYESDDEA